MDETAKANLIDLLVAIQNNEVGEVKKKIKVIKDINDIDDTYGETPLTTALSQFPGEKHNRLPIIQKLIEEGADVNKSNNDQETPLLLAVYSKNPHYVNILLENGADEPDDSVLNEAYKMLAVQAVPASDMPEEVPPDAMVAAVAAPPVAPKQSETLRRTSSSSSSSSREGEGNKKKRKKSKSKPKSKSKKVKLKKKTKKLKKPKKYDMKKKKITSKAFKKNLSLMYKVRDCQTRHCKQHEWGSSSYNKCGESHCKKEQDLFIRKLKKLNR